MAGTITCWGDNAFGELGNRGETRRGRSVAVPGLTSVTQLTGMDIHACVLVDEAVLCWGDNSEGEIGDGTTIQRNVPTQSAL